MDNGVRADLHLHTTASDGLNSVDERIQQAANRNLEALAITDHDTIPSSLVNRRKESNGIEIITGVEAKADFSGIKIEILGYYVDPEDKKLGKMLERIREFRHQRNHRIIEKIDQELDLKLDYEELKDNTEGLVARPYFAEKLVEEGFADSIGEAFDKYLGNEKQCFSEMERVSYTEVIETIKDAGGVCSLAHPGRIRSENAEKIISKLSDSDLDGLEAWYPYDQGGPGKRSGIGVKEARELAEKYDLCKTGGSDCHGENSGKFRIGSTGVDETRLNMLREKAGYT